MYFLDTTKHFRHRLLNAIGMVEHGAASLRKFHTNKILYVLWFVGNMMQSVFVKGFRKSKLRRLFSDGSSGPSFKRDNTDPCYACTQKGLPRFHSVSCSTHHSLVLDANAGSSLYPTNSQVSSHPIQIKCRRWIFGTVQDPRRRFIKKLIQFFLLVRLISLAVDPLLFYTIAVSKDKACVYMDAPFVVAFACLRSVCDIVHVFHIWLRLRLAYVSKESLILGSGSLVWDARKIARHYAQSGTGLSFDVFVIMPIPQVLLWFVIPYMIQVGEVTSIMTVCLTTFLLQYIPKLFHLVYFARRMRHVNGFVFGTVWWGFALNLVAYFVAAHVAGSCWYLLASQQVSTCLIEQCAHTPSCNSKFLGCTPTMPQINKTTLFGCLSVRDNGVYNYGIYAWAVPLVTGQSKSTKLLYPIFWGLMTLSSFGNALQPGDQTVEVAFCIIVITCGLLLFTLLIGNIEVFLHSITARKEAMKLRLRDLECWMRRRQLPSRIRRRVRRYERHHWTATQGVDESEMISTLPEGLRRDIKHHLSLDLVLQVPLFEHMDKLVLEHICERLKPCIFTKGEMIIREGDPVRRMLFIVRGHFLSSHDLHNGAVSICSLGPGNFCGDELLSWCLRKPFPGQLPPSYATLTSAESAEAFALEAEDLRFVIQHFGHKFVNEKLKRTLRYYSFGWRTWAVVTIQIAWRRHRARNAKITVDEPTDLPSMSRVSTLGRTKSECERLRLYAAIFTSPKPQDNLD